jgi:hypothetical protein
VFFFFAISDEGAKSGSSKTYENLLLVQFSTLS